MRILKLTAAVEKQLLRGRQQRDVEAERISARIIAEVRQRGDGALFAWAKKLDGAELRRDGAWISDVIVVVGVFVLGGESCLVKNLGLRGRR